MDSCCGLLMILDLHTTVTTVERLASETQRVFHGNNEQARRLPSSISNILETTVFQY